MTKILLLFTAFLLLVGCSAQTDPDMLAVNFPSIPSSCLSKEELDSLDSQLSQKQRNITLAAQERTSHRVTYVDKYYSNGGKPPDNEGVCTDLHWRAMQGAGIDFQKVLYEDMKAHKSAYPLSIWRTTSLDKNIDFRRVPNLEAYYKKNGTSLTTEILPCNFENLREWQAGDIVIFKLKPGVSDHVAIVSTKRDSDGIPYLIHNYGIGEVEESGRYWYDKVVGHYRVKDSAR